MTVNLDITALNDAVPPDNQTVKHFSSGSPRAPLCPWSRRNSEAWPAEPMWSFQGSGFELARLAVAPISHQPAHPNGGIVVNNETISGYAPAHDEGFVAVTVQSASGGPTGTRNLNIDLGRRSHRSLPPLACKAKTRPSGVAGRQLHQDDDHLPGSSLANAVALTGVTLATDIEIDGVVPPGSGQVTVWAFDPTTAGPALPNGFSWIEP